jgi:hypothetical protein
MMCDCPKGKRGEMCPDKAKVMRMHYPKALGPAMGIRARPIVGAAGAGAGSVAAGAGEGSAEAWRGTWRGTCRDSTGIVARSGRAIYTLVSL